MDDIDTLVDLEDYFDGSDAVANIFADEGGDILGMVGEDLPVPEAVEPEPIKEPKYEDIPQAVKIEEIVQRAEPPSQDLLSRAQQAAKENGEAGIKEFFDKLSEKDKNSMLRYTMSAMGVGAREALRAIQQRNEQQFRREQSDIAYQRRREEEASAAESRRIAGTPSAYQFSTTPRGLISGGMGG